MFASHCKIFSATNRIQTILEVQHTDKNLDIPACASSCQLRDLRIVDYNYCTILRNWITIMITITWKWRNRLQITDYISGSILNATESTSNILLYIHIELEFIDLLYCLQMELLHVDCPDELEDQAAEVLKKSKEKCKKIEVNLFFVIKWRCRDEITKKRIVIFFFEIEVDPWLESYQKINCFNKTFIFPFKLTSFETSMYFYSCYQFANQSMLLAVTRTVWQ